uniref:Protein MAIN-LIKE 2-like n=1 Tax=Cicer arietinum TaxID=3827 RepID=A0A1S2Y6A3_CICAR|nr:protein MAIN-LIKE 2-like [Cicer arietinum]
MRGAFGQIIRNIVGGDRGGDGVERIPPTASNRRRNEANRQIRHRRRRQDIHDDDRGPLKVITHGLKLKKFSEVLVPHPVERWIQESGLLPLSSAYLTMVDAGLVSAFIERWHRETSSFHLPFGEMTITLDDVATLLHISPNGKFFDAPVNMSTNNAARAAHELQWLRDLYSRLIQTNQFECAARTYLLHLVGSTIFADKTHTRVEAKYISLFIDLARCRHYSWAAAALVFLYDNMGDGAVHDTRQLGGYMTLLQCWIYEHFPRIYKRGDRGAVHAHLPRACRWIAKHAVEGGLVTYRQRLDALLLDDVLFTPYDDDRANHPFEDISMFSGYLRCGGVSVPYLPERCLRQFGPPLVLTSSGGASIDVVCGNTTSRTFALNIL